MAIDNDISSEVTSGNNSTTDAYAVGFPFFENTHIQVEVLRPDGSVTTLREGTDYTLVGAGDPAGGALVTTHAWSEENLLTISRNVPATQSTRYEEGGEFPSASHERALDKLTMLGQQLKRQARKNFRVREADGELAPARKVINSLAGLDASGHPVFRSADAVKAWLSLAAPILNYPTKTWEDDAERALTVPDFIGQVGTQRNQSSPPTALYVANGLAAGDWYLIDAGVPDGAITAGKLAAALDLSTKTLTLPNGVIGAGNLSVGAITDQAAVSEVDENDLLLIYDQSAAAIRKTSFAHIDFLPTGSVIQTVRVENTSNASINTIIPLDNSIPQISEGTQIISTSITPRSASSKILAFVNILLWSPYSHTNTCALFRGGVNDAIASQAHYTAGSYNRLLAFQHLDSPATSSEITYSIRCGIQSIGYPSALNLTQSGGNPLLGGKTASTLTLLEIKG